MPWGSLLLLLGVAGASAPSLIFLDAGSLASPVMEEFAALHPEGTTEPRATWVTSPTSSRWCNGPDPLAGDSVEGGVLHLDLSPGTWRLSAMMGRECGGRFFPWGVGEAFGLRVDGEEVLRVEVPEGKAFLDSEFYVANPFPVFREGETGWHRQVERRHAWREVAVDIGTGGVEIEVFGAPLQGLVAVPEERSAEGEVLLELADARRRAWFQSRVDPAGEHWALPSTGAGPLAVQVARWREWPDPARATPTPVLEWTASPGERVSAVLWLFPGADAASAAVHGLDLLEVQLFEAHWLDGSGHARQVRRPRPTFLRPVDGDLRGGQGVPVGVAVVGWVPDDVPSSVHRGVVVLERDGASVEVPIRLRVRDLELAPAPVPVGFFLDLRKALTLAFGSGSEPVWSAYETDLRMMSRRGFGVLGLRYASPWPERWVLGAPPDTALFEEAARRWWVSGGDQLVWIDLGPWLVRHGFRDRDLPVDDPRLDPVFRGLARAAIAHDAALFFYDEWGHRGFARVRRGRGLAEHIRASDGGVQLFAAALHPVSWDLAGAVDVIALAQNPVPSSEVVDHVRGRGATVWLYNLTPGRSASGLLPWLARPEAIIQWHWNDALGDPFHDLHQRGQYQYTLLAPEGREVWPTLLLESFAEGVTDQRYLGTLEGLVVRAERHRSQRKRTAAVRGRALLQAVRALDGSVAVWGGEGEVWTEADLDLLRRTAGDEAEALQRCLQKNRCRR
ncbi:MAG: hypothetical protein JRI25_01565 [Deltaproteobacteria bacterium]|nr:hypothetical protein [Deltaproteobacteria bacterium]MBW2253268.1 hypothetical protein [Deltaproteobacteria bacterium]